LSFLLFYFFILSILFIFNRGYIAPEILRDEEFGTVFVFDYLRVDLMVDFNLLLHIIALGSHVRQICTVLGLLDTRWRVGVCCVVLYCAVLLYYVMLWYFVLCMCFIVVWI
jgi:hypothetical protein